MPADAIGDSFDPARILATLAAHGALRQTYDLDLVPQPSQDNYEHLAAALQELNARLRVGGMTDEEARQLPVQVDGRTLRSFGRGRQPTPRQFGMSLQRRPGRRL